MNSKEFDKAEKLIDEAMQLNQGSSESMMNKAVLLAMKNDEMCVDFFDKAISADPENLLAYKNLGLFLFRQNDHKQAADVFKKAIEIEPANAEFYNSLGSIYGIQGDYGKAIEMFEKALVIEPGNKNTLKDLMLTYEKKKV